MPFKYYFKQPNPAGALPGDDPARAQELIADAVRKSGGAWLISGKTRRAALAELPSGPSFQVDFEHDYSRVLLLHIRLAGHDVGIPPVAASAQCKNRNS